MIRCCGIILLLTATACAQELKIEDPTEALIGAFSRYRIVMLGEIHESRQQHELLRNLISRPGFAENVNDIVVEFGNPLYQETVDRYISGEDVAMEEVQKAWRNTLALGPFHQSMPSSTQRYARSIKSCRGNGGSGCCSEILL